MTLPQQFRSKLLVSTAIFAVPLFLAQPAHAAAKDPSAAQKYEAEADKLIAKDDGKSAVIEMRNAIKADPENPALRLKLAGLEISLNDIESAQVDLKAAREHGADETKVIPLLGRTYAVQGKFDQMLQDFPVRDDATPAVRAVTLVVRAEAQLQLKHVEDAKSSLMAAEALQPDLTTPRIGLARIAFTNGQYDDADKEADELLKISPTADVYILKGEIQNHKNDQAGALASFDQAIKADPNNVGGLIERAQIYIAQGEDAKAAADIKAALAIAPRSVPAAYFQALLATRAKDYASADTILTKYASAFPNFPHGYYLLAIVKSALNQYEQAEAAITAYLASTPDDVQGQKLYAEIMLKKGNAVGAADVLEKVTAKNQDDPQALALLGQAYMQQNKSEQAVDAFERASKLAPDNASLLRDLALNHLAEGQGAQGTAELEKALQMSPEDQASAEALVVVYIRQKQFDKAAQIAADLRKKRPTDPVPANMAGMVELAQAHLPQAEAIYQDVVKQFPDFVPAKLELAQIQSTEGRMDDAKATYQAILAKDPSNIAALENLTRMMAGQGQSDQAIELWQKSHRAQPDNISIAVGLIQALIIKKDFDTGLAVVRDMQVRQPNEPRLYAMRAELQLQSDKPKDAIESLRRLSDLQPQDPAARRDLAIAQEKGGDLPGAIATIGEARKLDPNNIGLAAEEIRLLGRRNPDDGVAAAQRLAKEMPDQPLAQALEGDYLITLKRQADAGAAFKRAFQAQPSLVLAERVAESFVREGKPAEGKKVLADWAAAHPNDLPPRYALANFAMGQKDWGDAKTLYEGLIKERPDDPLVQNNLAVIYQHDNDPRALEMAQKAHDSQPNSAAIADTLGWIMVNTNDVPTGIKFIQQAHDNSPNDLDVDYHLAFALNRSGKKADAIVLLKKAIDAGRDFDSKKDAQTLLDQLSKG
jgi:putative PEP-CTERM system TPR-repeat lipoprotein